MKKLYSVIGKTNFLKEVDELLSDIQGASLSQKTYANIMHNGRLLQISICLYDDRESLFNDEKTIPLCKI